MHELGIVSGILETVSRAARDAGALRVIAVTLRIGDMREVGGPRRSISHGTS